MRPFRSRVAAAIVLAVLMLGLLGNVANAGQIPTSCFPEDPWNARAVLINNVPEVPWNARGFLTSNFPEDPWPGLF